LEREESIRQSMAAEIEAARAAISAAQSQSAEVTQEIARLDFWLDGFGNAGIKSFILEAEMPEVSRKATAYAQRLIAPGAYISVSTTRALKSRDAVKEELTITASIPGCTTSYGAASKGQRRRLDIAVLLAFRAVMARRAGVACDQLFVDEVFDGLDAVGCAVVVEILREIALGAPVVVITHDRNLKAQADRVVSVIHDGTRAALADQPAVRTTGPRKRTRK
jgi:DNA repair exonuclease SbcCD ATPase subunit